MMRFRARSKELGSTTTEFVAGVLVLLLLWSAVTMILELLSEHNDEYTQMMSSPLTWQAPTRDEAPRRVKV